MKCLECKREFVLNRIDKKFCSRLCYNKHYWQGYYVKHREKILKKNRAWNKANFDKRGASQSR